MQTCLLSRVFNSGGAVALEVVKPRGGGNTERKEGEWRKEATLTEKQSCAGHYAKDFPIQAL